MLRDLPTSFLEQNLNANPGAQVFSWVENGQAVTRDMVLGELQRRGTGQGPEVQSVLQQLESRANGPRHSLRVPSADVQRLITAVIFTSPLPSHPSTHILEKVYGSVRAQLPHSRIIVLADGDGRCIRRWCEAYVAYKTAVKDLGWELGEFVEPSHQTLMLKYTLSLITTPFVLVGEGDMEIHPRFIDWDGLTKALGDPTCPFRCAQIRRGDDVPFNEQSSLGSIATYHGVDLLGTKQFQVYWHLARTGWYRNLMRSIDVPEALSGSQVANLILSNGANRELAWYVPDGPLGFLTHLDGRFAMQGSI